MLLQNIDEKSVNKIDREFMQLLKLESICLSAHGDVNIPLQTLSGTLRIYHSNVFVLFRWIQI